jgi:hypothetical protein
MTAPKWTKQKLAAWQAGVAKARARLAKERPRTREWEIGGVRYVCGTAPGSGMLAFHPDGSVSVHAAEHAVFARKRATRPDATRTAAFETAHSFRRLAQQGHHFPPDWRDPAAAHQLASLHTAAVWPLVLALAEGNSKPLRELADAIDLLRRAEAEAVVESAVMAALVRAAEEAGAPPTRPAVLAEFEAARGIPKHDRGKYAETVRQALQTLGFSWLAGPTGRPRKGGTKRR